MIFGSLDMLMFANLIRTFVCVVLCFPFFVWSNQLFLFACFHFKK